MAKTRPAKSNDPGKRRGPKAAPKAQVKATRGAPSPPACLDLVAADHWRLIAGLMFKAGLLTDLDLDGLELYCTTWSRWKEAEAEVKKEGAVIETPNKYKQANPWYTIGVQCLKDLRTFIGLFGLSPAARAKLTLPDAAEDDGSAKWKDVE